MKKTKLMVFVVLGLLVISSPIILYYGSGEYVSLAVTDKERVVTGRGENQTSKYLVFTEAETFENTDDLFLWKFNSSDMYGKIQQGGKYRAKVYGWRVPFLSWYRNIATLEVK